jgi:beta-phosphoglucomutase-like phosphatase (HAD superfamily)
MNNRAVILHLLRQNELVDCFDEVLTVEMISNSKPDPEILINTAGQLVTKPQACVVFEDSIFGVKAAKSAGMGCIAVTTGVYNEKELKVERPDLVVESLRNRQILPLIFQ